MEEFRDLYAVLQEVRERNREIDKVVDLLSKYLDRFEEEEQFRRRWWRLPRCAEDSHAYSVCLIGGVHVGAP